MASQRPNPTPHLASHEHIEELVIQTTPRPRPRASLVDQGPDDGLLVVQTGEAGQLGALVVHARPLQAGHHVEEVVGRRVVF